MFEAQPTSFLQTEAHVAEGMQSRAEASAPAAQEDLPLDAAVAAEIERTLKSIGKFSPMLSLLPVQRIAFFQTKCMELTRWQSSQHKKKPRRSLQKPESASNQRKSFSESRMPLQWNCELSRNCFGCKVKHGFS